MKRSSNTVGPQVGAGKKNQSKLLPVLGIASFIAGMQGATQYFAYKFAYHMELGWNIGHVYAPWSIFGWSAKWYGLYPDAIMRASSVGTIITAVGLIGVAIAKVISSNTSRANEYLHGSARWANKKDIQTAGLLPRDRSILEILSGKPAPVATGVYVGGWQDKDGTFYYLRHSGPQHVLTYAPTRSGKGVGLVVPTLLSWAESAVITDLKGELWALTAGWRRQHAKNKVLRFEPASIKGGICWNPLDEIRLGSEYEVGDVQNLATLIVDPDGKGLETHWQKTAFALLVGVILHALYQARNGGGSATLPLVDAMLSDPNRDIRELWMEMVTTGHVDGQNHPGIGSAARDMLDRPDEEAGSVLSTAKSYLSLYRDPVVARNVNASDFRIKQLMNHPASYPLRGRTHTGSAVWSHCPIHTSRFFRNPGTWGNRRR